MQGSCEKVISQEFDYHMTSLARLMVCFVTVLKHVAMFTNSLPLEPIAQYKYYADALKQRTFEGTNYSELGGENVNMLQFL